MRKLYYLFTILLLLILNLNSEEIFDNNSRESSSSTNNFINMLLDTNQCSVLDTIKITVTASDSSQKIPTKDVIFRLNNVNNEIGKNSISWIFPDLKDTLYGEQCIVDSIPNDTNFYFFLNSQTSGSNLKISMEEIHTEFLQYSDDFDFIPGKTDSMLILYPEKIYQFVEHDYTIIPVDTFGNINFTDAIWFKLTARDPEVMALSFSNCYIKGPQTYTLVSCDTISNQWIKYYKAMRTTENSDWEYIADPVGQTECFSVHFLTELPKITIDSPQKGETYTSSSIQVTGEVTSDTLINYFSVNDNQVSLNNNGFDTTVIFHDFEGDTSIIVYTEDILGLTATKKVNFRINTSKPYFTKTLPDTIIEKSDTLTFQYEARDTTDDATNLNYSLFFPTSEDIIYGLKISRDGYLEWAPYDFQTGNHKIIIQVSDGTYMVKDTALVKVIEDVGIASNIPITKNFELYQNYPNPFNPSTTIEFYLPKTQNVEISIYSITGKRIKNLVNESMKMGYHTINWNATNDNGSIVSSGSYLYLVKCDGKIFTKKMLYIK